MTTARVGRFALIVAIAAGLSACADTGLKQPEPITTVKVIQTTSFPELPDIQTPLEPTLIPWEYEVPRDMSKTEPKNTTECLGVAEKDRGDAFWERCGEHPVIRDTNVLFGFDQRNWNIMLSNFSKLREYVLQLRARIDLANESRRDWRRRAEEERNKADAAAKTTAAATK